MNNYLSRPEQASRGALSFAIMLVFAISVRRKLPRLAITPKPKTTTKTKTATKPSPEKKFFSKHT